MIIDILNQTLSINEEQDDEETVSNSSLPSGLEKTFEEAAGLKGILDKFHERENLLNAIS